MTPRRVMGWSLVGLLGLGGMGALGVAARKHMDGNDLETALVRSEADEAWLEGLPTVDPDVRERAWQWMKTSWPTGNQGSSSKDANWYLEGGKPPAELVARHEAERAHMARLAELLGSEGPVLSSVAWLDPDLSTNGHGPYGPKHIPNLLSVRHAMRWYGVEAMLRDDPTAPLDGADRLFEALQPCGGLIDAMILVATDSMRDEIYLRAAYRGALSSERRTRWLQEPCDAERWHTDACRAERLLLWEPLARGVLEGSPNAKKALYGDSAGPGAELDYAWYARRDLARVIDGWHLYEDYLAGRCDGNALEIMDTWAGEGGRTASMALPNHLLGLIWNLVASRAQHRLSRLLARTLDLGSTAPATEAELAERLASDPPLGRTGRFDMSIRYQRVAPDRIRFYVPKDTPLPSVLEPRRREHAFTGTDRAAGLDDTLLGRTPGYAIEARLPR